jgi:hypothetical protein
MASVLRPRYLTETEIITLANAEEDLADSDDNVVDSGSSTDDEDGDTATDVRQDVINYDPQREMFIGVGGPTGSAQSVTFKHILAGICWTNASTNKPLCSAI